ncbi:MAG: ChaN family lipoprotein [Gemmatimonadales bacterium]
MVNFVALALALAAPAHDTIPEFWAPHRVYDSHHKRFSDFEALVEAASAADVVLLGEHHDDPGTHLMELALLQEIARRRDNVVVTLEMFERDVQPALDRYLAGAIPEDSFLEIARPWPNYPTDYRPLVEFAKAHHWRVVAGNVPRRMAAAVSARGLDAVTRLSDSTRAWAAADIECPRDDYFKRFQAAMGDHPMGSGTPTTPQVLAATTERFYLAQCLKDETMAESIARVRSDASRPLVIQYNGDFHSDYGEGTAARVRRRLPGARVVVISAVPVATLDSIKAKPLRKQGDWLLFTLGAPPAEAAAGLSAPGAMGLISTPRAHSSVGRAIAF